MLETISLEEYAKRVGYNETKKISLRNHSDNPGNLKRD